MANAARCREGYGAVLRLDLTTLNLVLAIADTRSITRGAAREHLALAAASKRLSDLEARFGVALFERRARGVEPTEAGRALLRHVRTLHNQLHALESEVVEFSRGIRGHLRLVANVSAISECLPPDLAAFSEAHPQIRISLEEESSADVQAAVAEGRADVGVFVGPQTEPSLRLLPYRQGRLAVVVPQGHPLAKKRSVGFAQLLDLDLIGLHEGAAAHRQMLQAAESAGRTLKARLSVRGFEAIAQLVEAGLGVAVMPETSARRLAQVHALKLLALAEPWAERHYLLAVKAQAVLPSVVQRFVDALSPPTQALNDSGD